MAGSGATLLILIATAVVAASADQCNEGEVFWCSSFEAATRCDAVGHCVDTVWKNQEPMKDNSDSCGFCRAVVADARMSRNRVDDSVDAAKSLALAACDLLTETTSTSKCKQLILSENFLTVVDSDVDSQMVCSLMQFCKGVSDVAEENTSPVQNDPPLTWEKVSLVKVQDQQSCSECQKYFSALKTFLGNSTEKFLQQFLLAEVCPALGSIYKIACEAAVKDYLPKAFDLLLQKYNVDLICRSLRMCPRSTVALDLESDLDAFDMSDLDLDLGSIDLEELTRTLFATKTEESRKCKFCKAIVDFLLEFFKTGAIQNTIQSLLKKYVCSKFGPFKDPCEKSVDAFFPVIFQQLGKLTSDQLCQRLCRKMDAVQEEAPTIPEAVPQNINPVSCIVCRTIVNLISHLLPLNKTEQEILDAMHQVCRRLPKTACGICNGLVDAYGKFIIDVVVKQITSGEICRTLRLCSNDAGDSPLTEEVLAAALSTNACLICQTSAQYAIELLDQNVGPIQRLLDGACAHLPAPPARSVCKAFVDNLLPSILHRIVSSFPPQKLCRILRLCTSLPSASVAMTMQASVPSRVGHVFQCIGGPEFWCASRDNALLCQATDHCERSVWKK